jgi:adenine-specific DNA methylase
MLDKAIIYNCRLSRFDPTRGIRSVFDRHDFAFIWSFAEFDAAANLLPWVAEQVADAYQQIAVLSAPARPGLGTAERQVLPADSVTITQGTAASLAAIPDGAIHNITVDPPYYDNVMYAELSDFFYVWLKRSVGDLYPEFFREELTNKDDEAVANVARFAALGPKKRDLAHADYERKMAAAFREMHRVLRPDGVLTVMFTHKKVEAWDTLAQALIGAGFAIEASWPVHTESEHSLHQAQKNAASSTILLVCRKRDVATGEAVWWDDLQGRVRETARAKASEFAAAGIQGVDLYISVFGPTLRIISEQWPVLTSEVDPVSGKPRTLRPETALDLAREEVVRLRKEGLLGGREVRFDPVTDWYLMAWDAFKAAEFPYDEARKLAIAVGVDLDKTIMAGERLAAKKGEFVVLQTPVQRRRKDVVDGDATSFGSWIDAAHTAMMVYEEDKEGACDIFLRRTGLKSDGTFKALLGALLAAIPRTKLKGKSVRPEAAALTDIALNLFPDVPIPAEAAIPAPRPVQPSLLEPVEDDTGEDEA